MQTANFSFFFLCMALFIIVIAIGGTIFWVWALVDCATNEPPQDNSKLTWILIIIFTHFIGALLYFLIRRPERQRLYGR